MSRSGIYDLKYGFIPDDDVPQEPPKQTNGDRIRSMTDEELAHAIMNDFESPTDMQIPWCQLNVCCDTTTLDCEACVLKWLKKEAKE